MKFHQRGDDVGVLSLSVKESYDWAHDYDYAHGDYRAFKPKAREQLRRELKRTGIERGVIVEAGGKVVARAEEIRREKPGRKWVEPRSRGSRRKKHNPAARISRVAPRDVKWDRGFKSSQMHNESDKIQWKGHWYWLDSGTSDDVNLFHEGKTLYALTTNSRLGYVGVQAFEDGKQIGDVFVQVDHEIESMLGPKGLDLSPVTILKRLIPYAVQ